jgi:hypothetical protein
LLTAPPVAHRFTIRAAIGISVATLAPFSSHL